MNRPWKSDKWFVSSLNYEEEVASEFVLSEKIRIHDVTLRDGEQQAGLVFNRDEKVEIAEKLAEAGVHRIEVGMPAVSKQDKEAIKKIAGMGLDAEIFCFSRCMIDDVKRALDCGVDGIVIEIPSSEHIIEYAYNWPLQKAIDLSIEATSFAKENGLYTVFFPIDATRAEINWFLDLIEKVATEGHMDALAVVDTFGVLSPHAVSFLIKKIKERIKKPLEAHFHNDFGLATANTLMALTQGAEVAQTSVSSIGERAGNASFEEVVLSLLTMYGKDIGIDYKKLYPLSKFILGKIPGYSIATNRPIVGDKLYNIESGIIADWVLRCGEEHILEAFPFKWDLIGHSPKEIVLGKGSGRRSIIHWLEKIGICTSDNNIDTVLLKVKEKSLEKKGLLTENEFKETVAEIVGDSFESNVKKCH